MDTFIINKIEKNMNQSRFHAQLVFKTKMEALYKKHPNLLLLENEKRSIASDFNLSKEEKSNKLASIESKINSFISDNNIKIPTIIYNCNICNDTGYIETNGQKARCACFNKKLIDEAMKDETVICSHTFDDFNEDLFDQSIKEKVLYIRDYLKAYAKNFPDVKKPNTFICGNTGTGKTFLLSCLHSELKKNGVASVFITAGKLFDYLKKYAFNQINDLSPLIEADILIIDDIGAEPMFNNITTEYMYLLINERIQNKKPICISSNLTPAQIKSHYSERLSSRLIDKPTTSIIEIPGKDLRLRF